MFAAVETALTDNGYQIADAELRWEAKNESEIPVEKAVQNMRLMEQLEELDDVQGVASNLAITDDVIAALEKIQGSTTSGVRLLFTALTSAWDTTSKR
jgi:hypothetical protein